jgi:hypothetical protein
MFPASLLQSGVDDTTVQDEIVLGALDIVELRLDDRDDTIAVLDVELGKLLVVEYGVDDGDEFAVTLVDVVWDRGPEDEDITLVELDGS